MTERKLKAKEVALIREEMLASQAASCPLCTRTVNKPALDHDHTHGHIRAVLCSWCNANLGRIENASKRIGTDVPFLTFLENCVTYLKRYTETPSSILHHTYKSKEEKRTRAKERAKKTRLVKRSLK